MCRVDEGDWFDVFCCRSDLIDRDIERAVALMQSVIELGRYIRDIKVIPVKVNDVML